MNIWTDGSTRPTNPGPGGAAWLIKRAGRTTVGSVGYIWTTNNRMELRAAFEALCLVNRGSCVTLYSDSAYIVNAFNKRWLWNWERHGFCRADGSHIKNEDLWRTLSEVVKELDITWVHICGHSGLSENEQVDKLAGEAAQHPSLVDQNYIREIGRGMPCP
jgi:ribonuclease HI